MARIANRSKLFISLIAASFALCAVARAALADCLTYGGNATLDGWLSLKPAAGNVKGSHWSIKLAKPACVAADTTNPAIDAAPRIDLKVSADQDKAFRDQFNKRVKVSGTLNGAEAGHVTLDGASLAQ